MSTPSTVWSVWPEGVIARYLTVSGGTVDLRKGAFCAEGDVDGADCTGCGWNIDWRTSEQHARSRAQAHAETCRALPKPSL